MVKILRGCVVDAEHATFFGMLVGCVERCMVRVAQGAVSALH